MKRRIYIIRKPAGAGLTNEELAAAREANCPEIAFGIPPALVGLVSEEDLPCIYEEPEAEVEDIVDEVKELLSSIEHRLDALEGKA